MGQYVAMVTNTSTGCLQLPCSVENKSQKCWAQGDKERACGMPVSPLMDRSTQGGMTRSQLGFFSIVGIPLFKAMVDLFEDAKPMLDGVLANYAHWENNTDLADLP